MAFQPSTPESPDQDGFRVQSAAEAGELPEEVQNALQTLAEAVSHALDEPSGVVGLRFGRRVVVAPVDDPGQATDVCDVDIGRRIALTVGGRDPGPAGLLLAQVLFLRTEEVVGYADADGVPGPTMEVLEKVLVPLRTGPAGMSGNIGPVVLGKLPSDLPPALHAAMAEANEGEGDDDEANDVNAI